MLWINIRVFDMFYVYACLSLKRITIPTTEKHTKEAQGRTDI